MDAREHNLHDGRRIVLRPARVEDACRTLTHINAVCAETDFSTFGPGELERTVADQEGIIRDHLESPLKLLLLALSESDVVGTLDISAPARARVRHRGEFGMSVRKAYWGLGIGSVMVDFLIDWARSTNVLTKLNLRVRTDNDRAIALYRSKGFVVEGTITRDLRVDGCYFDHYSMGLTL